MNKVLLSCCPKIQNRLHGVFNECEIKRSKTDTVEICGNFYSFASEWDSTFFSLSVHLCWDVLVLVYIVQQLSVSQHWRCLLPSPPALPHQSCRPPDHLTQGMHAVFTWLLYFNSTFTNTCTQCSLGCYILTAHLHTQCSLGCYILTACLHTHTPSSKLWYTPKANCWTNKLQRLVTHQIPFKQDSWGGGGVGNQLDLHTTRGGGRRG